MGSVRESLSLLKTAAGPRASAPDARMQFSIFAFLLALAILFHQSHLGDWEVLSSHMAVSLAAIFVLVRPSSPLRFFAMLAIQLVSLLIDMPNVVNHWLLLGLTTVGLAAGLGLAAIRRRPWLSDPGEIYRRVAPVVRIQVVLVYLFAVLAKLNTDFLDPALSCGAAMSADLLASGPISLHGSWQDGPAIAGTLLIEALLPIGLLLRRTRVAAVLLGSGFHTVLAIAGHVPFSGFAFAFYALFLPDDLPRRLRAVLEGMPALRTAAARAQAFARSRLAFPLLAGGWIVAAIAVSYGPDQVYNGILRLAAIIFVVYAASLGAVLLLCLRRGGPGTYAPGTLRLAHPVWALAPLLVVLNAVTPYVGLKTQSAFTMYSNLQTEDGRWNHVLVPESVRIFDLQDDTVEVIRSSDERLAEAAGDDTKLIEHDFRTYLSQHPELSVTYRHGGQVVTVPRVGAASDGPGLVARRLLLFRDVPLASRNVCRDGREGGPAQGS
jgi:hypothetical protein